MAALGPHVMLLAGACVSMPILSISMYTPPPAIEKNMMNGQDGAL